MGGRGGWGRGRRWELGLNGWLGGAAEAGRRLMAGGMSGLGASRSTCPRVRVRAR